MAAARLLRPAAGLVRPTPSAAPLLRRGAGHHVQPPPPLVHPWSPKALAVLEGYARLPGYEEVPASYEPPPIAAAHHQELNFIRSPGPEGLPRFASSLVVSKAEKTLHGVLYFGRHTLMVVLAWFGGLAEGPPGCVHGGAIAAYFDNIMGWLVWLNDYFAATANLNVNYQSFVPTDSEVTVLARIAKVEDRKLFVEAEMHSLDGSKAHGNAKALFIHLKQSSRPSSQASAGAPSKSASQ